MRKPHAERVIVDASLEDRIENLLLGEEQVYDERTGKYARPENLNVVYTKEDPAVASSIWMSHQLPGYGDPEKARPEIPNAGTSLASPSVLTRRNDNMGAADQARVREWTRNVDVNADPLQAASSPVPSDPGAEEPCTTRVVAASDSECETAPAGEMVRRVVAASDSDSETATAGETVRRVVAQDSDDEPSIPVRRMARNPARSSSRDAQIRPPASNYRSDRANRRQDRSSVEIPSARNSANLVAADSFFAGVPRDTNEMHGNASESQLPSLGSTRNTHTRNAPTSNTPHGGFGFGFDGAGSSSNNGAHRSPENPHTRLIANQADMTPRKPWFCPFSQSNTTERRSGFDQFDPDNYDPPWRGGRKIRGYPTNRGTFTTSPGQQPVNIWPGPSVQRELSTANRRQDLITAQEQDRPVGHAGDECEPPAVMTPPPGLSTGRSANGFGVIETPYISDEPLNMTEGSSTQPAWGEDTVSANDESLASMSNVHHPIYSYSVQRKVNKPNIEYLRDEMMNQLVAAKNTHKSKKQSRTARKQGSERINPEDEVSTRKYHQTMNLKAPNSGRTKKNKANTATPSGETAAEKAERIAKTKAELGLGPMPNRASQFRTQKIAPEAVSKRSQQAARSNAAMELLHADSLKASSRKKIAGEFVQQMRPAFEVAQLFPGKLIFELQVGQLLVMPMSRRLKPGTAYEREKWKAIFGSGASAAEVYFTSLLTTSGSDVDGILQTKTEGTKTWDTEVPGAQSIVLDFECQDSSGLEFTLHFNTDGSHSMSNNLFTIHQVGIHCPGRTWDACAVLKGIPIWHNVSEALRKSISDLVASIYVKPGAKVDVFFRMPLDNSLSVREVTARRTSLHNSQLAGEEQLRLKIVESKVLYMTGHKKDKRLTRCSERNHEVMARDDKVHFEVSLVHEGFEQDLRGNESLQAGETTQVDSEEPTAFNYDRGFCILDAALRLVDKIDWVGGCNLGTIVRRDFQRRQKEEEAAQGMPPAMLDHSFLRPAYLPSTMTVLEPRSTTGPYPTMGSTVGGSTQIPVHGLRANTAAQIVTDGRTYYRIGLGGAVIPMEIVEESSGAGDGVVPDDSASQAGGARRHPGKPVGRPDSFVW